MDDHTDAHSGKDSRPRNWLKLIGPPACVLSVGLTITALGASKQSSVDWAYGALIVGFSALVCALVSFSWYRDSQMLLTTRKLLQKQNRQLNNIKTEKSALRRALDDSELRSRDLVSLSGAIIWEIDELGRIGYVSDRITEVLGFAAANLAGTDLTSLISEGDQTSFKTTLETTRQDRLMGCINLNLKNAKGQSMPATFRVVPLHDTLHGFSGYRLSSQHFIQSESTP